MYYCKKTFRTLHRYFFSIMHISHKFFEAPLSPLISNFFKNKRSVYLRERKCEGSSIAPQWLQWPKTEARSRLCPSTRMSGIPARGPSSTTPPRPAAGSWIRSGTLDHNPVTTRGSSIAGGSSMDYATIQTVFEPKYTFLLGIHMYQRFPLGFCRKSLMDTANRQAVCPST